MRVIPVQDTKKPAEIHWVVLLVLTFALGMTISWLILSDDPAAKSIKTERG